MCLPLYTIANKKMQASMAAWSTATLFVTVSAPTYRQEEERRSTRPFSIYIAVAAVREVTCGPKRAKAQPPKPLPFYSVEFVRHIRTIRENIVLVSCIDLCRNMLPNIVIQSLQMSQNFRMYCPLLVHCHPNICCL